MRFTGSPPAPDSLNVARPRAGDRATGGRMAALQRAWRRMVGRRVALRRARQLYTRHEPLRIDIGCGATPRPGFVGVDLHPAADIHWDLAWGLPFADETVVEIRSDHCFEHLELPRVVEVLRACHRVLVPGGQLDFSVPHIDPYLEAYARRDRDFLHEKIVDVPAEQAALYDTCFDRIAWLLLRSGEHRSLFDRESILHKTHLAGFHDVRTRDVDPDRDPDPRFSSVYVVATR
jgi:predicted SAM-dependent methyltransferase